MLTGSLGEIINGDGKRIGSIDMPLGDGAVSAAAFFRTPVLHPSAAMRFQALHQFGARYGIDFLQIVPESERLTVPGLAEDYFLFGQLSMVSHCLNLKNRLIKFRWHDSNISKVKELAQLKLAVDISRNLAKSFAAMHGVANFDPAPFSNHGMRLLNIVDQSNFDREFLALEKSLRTVMADGPAFCAEMSFRHSVAVRATMPMLKRYAMHAHRCGLAPHESHTVKAWLLRKMRKQPCLQMTLNDLPT